MLDVIKRGSVVVLVVAAALLSFEYNFFSVASAQWFKEHQLGSEQLILDGLLHGPDEFGRLTLGRYSRPELKAQRLLAHELYSAGDRSGNFKPYKSQYGLQLKTFDLLSKVGLGAVDTLQFVTALLMSAVVGALFWLIRRDFSEVAAYLFAGALIFSPWVVVFARNLYWVQATWFIPLIITMYFARDALFSSSSTSKMGILLFFAYAAKCLCGYEYLTTIFIASCVPIAYHATRNHCGIRLATAKLAVNGLAFMAAFVVAASIHAYSLSRDGGSGLDQIALTAQKRLWSDSPDELAKATCDGNPDCETLIAASLQSNSLSVAKGYLVSTDFLPFLGRLDLDGPSAMAKVGRFVRGYALVGLIAVMILALPRMSAEIRVISLISLLAPLSWFFVAKGHSYIHYQLNYVLWYLPFIPFCLTALASLRVAAEKDHGK